MFKKLKHLKIFVITILVSMVFAVNVGFTFATNVNDEKVDYTMPAVSTDVNASNDRQTYLNDIIVNNSTINIPIAYTLGTVQREINFDYSFTETMDVAVTYEMRYTDGTEVNNAILNIVDRDRYIQDQEMVLMDNYASAYNSSSASGTLYYLDTIQGTGNKKLFSGVTFLTGNNKVENYIANSTIVVGQKEYTQGTEISAVGYQYTTLEISRFWEENELNSLNQPINYKCRTGYSITVGSVTTTIEKDTVKTKAEYESYLQTINTQISGYWTKYYKCLNNFSVSSNSFVQGNMYTAQEYNNAITLGASAGNFQVVYLCNTDYRIDATEAIIGSSNTIRKDTVITSDEYMLLLPTEQAYFSVSKYKTFENKNLVIDVKVYTKVSGGDYSSDHYFKNYKPKSSVSSPAFSYWLQYKNNAISQNISMIYNGHAQFKNGLPYAIDFGATEDMTSVLSGSKSNLTSSYIYRKDSENSKFYAYAGGNKYYAGVGVYYMTSNSAVRLVVQVSASWYNSNGDPISSMPINTINLKYGNNGSGTFTQDLSANSCGYVDVLDYIQTITEGDLFDLRGYSIVISSVTATFESLGGNAGDSSSAVKFTNSTSYNPILYKFSNQGMSTKLDFNITITNNTSSPIAIPTVTLKPTFTAYNGSTSISSDPIYGYGVANEVSGSGVNGFGYIYDNTMWSVSGNVFTGASGRYIPPYGSLVVASGVNIPTQTATNFWSFNMGGSEDYGFNADYWFEVGVSYTLSASSVTYSAISNYSSAEIMTSLTHSKESTQNGAVESYIAVRNNTLQTITNVTYEGVLKLAESSNTVDYGVETSGGYTKTENEFTVTLSNIDLLPGESLFICKLTIDANQSYDGDYGVWLTSSSAKVALSSGNSSVRSGIYFKRDFASGNLSIVNGNASGTENGLKITGLSNMIDSHVKWDENYQFIQVRQNLFDEIKMEQGYLPLSGAYPTNNSSYQNASYEIISLKAGEKVKVTFNNSSDTNIRIRYIDNDTNQVSGNIIAGTNEYCISNFTPANGFTVGEITALKDLKLGVMYLQTIPNNFDLKVLDISSGDTFAKFRNGQMIHLVSGITSNLSGYGYSNITIS